MLKEIKKKVIENMRKERDYNRRTGRFQKKQYELEKKRMKCSMERLNIRLATDRALGNHNINLK